VSSITFGMAMISAQAKNVGKTKLWLVVTGLLGVAFLSLEIYEFQHLIHLGAGPQRSGFLTVQLSKHGMTPENFRRLACLSLFWHFLDLVWIFVFTFVYLMGVLP
jgi:cytochrome o ubiquinol oxidase subunit 3